MGGGKNYDVPEATPAPKYAQDAPTTSQDAKDRLMRRSKNNVGLMSSVKTSGLGLSNKAETGKKLLSGTS